MAITESHTRSSTPTSTDDIYPLTNPHPPFTNAAAQPRVGNDTRHLLQNSAWNEAAKMSGQRGPECKFRHAFCLGPLYLAQDSQPCHMLLFNTHGRAFKTLPGLKCKDNPPHKYPQMSSRLLRGWSWTSLKYARLDGVGNLRGCAPCKRCLHTLIFKTLRCVNMVLILLSLLRLLSLV